MVHVSKQELHQDVQKQLFDDLEELFVANVKKYEFGNVLFELLSPTERLMLAKRLGIINALTQGYASHTISKLFKVSPSTVFRVQHAVESNRVPRIIAILRNKTGRRKFLRTLESLVPLGFPGIPQKRLRAQINHDIERWRAGA